MNSDICCFFCRVIRSSIQRRVEKFMIFRYYFITFYFFCSIILFLHTCLTPPMISQLQSPKKQTRFDISRREHLLVSQHLQTVCYALLVTQSILFLVISHSSTAGSSIQRTSRNQKAWTSICNVISDQFRRTPGTYSS